MTPTKIYPSPTPSSLLSPSSPSSLSSLSVLLEDLSSPLPSPAPTKVGFDLSQVELDKLSTKQVLNYIFYFVTLDPKHANSYKELLQRKNFNGSMILKLLQRHQQQQQQRFHEIGIGSNYDVEHPFLQQINEDKILGLEEITNYLSTIGIAHNNHLSSLTQGIARLIMDSEKISNISVHKELTDGSLYEGTTTNGE